MCKLALALQAAIVCWDSVYCLTAFVQFFLSCMFAMLTSMVLWTDLMHTCCHAAATVASAGDGQTQSQASSETHSFGKRTMIDGGVIANNPTLVALTWMHEHKLGKPQDVAVLSLGTGMAVVDAMTAAKGGGKWHWKSQLVNVLMGSASEAMDAIVDSFYYEACCYYAIDMALQNYLDCWLWIA